MSVWNKRLQSAITLKGSIDCSGNPNYPAARLGDMYVVSVAGKIGGASGVAVDAQDQILCIVSSSAGGTQAAVGADFSIIQGNVVGGVTSSSASSINLNIPVFDGTSGKMIKDAGINVATFDAAGAAAAVLSTSLQKTSKATDDEITLGTEDAKYTTPLGLNDAAVGSWSYFTGFSRISDSSFSVTDNAKNQDRFRLGRPLRYADTIGTWLYGIVTAYSTGTVTLSGAPMTTSFDGYLQYGRMTRAIQVDIFIANLYGNGVDTDLLFNDMKTKLVWRHGKAYCVKFSAMEASVDTGTEPKVNLYINGATVSTTDTNKGIQLTTAGTIVENAVTDINTSNYDVNKGELVTVGCTEAGGTGDASDLTVSATFIME